MRAMLSIETLRSDRSTPLRYVRLMPYRSGCLVEQASGGARADRFGTLGTEN
jgi:hypothetical protein